MRINEVEKLVGIPKKNIRFYEEQGLLHPGREPENGYRSYGAAEVETLRKIRLLRQLAVPIEEIRSLQLGRITLSDCMERHGVLLNREQRNLQQISQLCAELAGSQTTMDGLDTADWEARLRALEEGGVRFMSVRHDRRKKKTAPLIVAAVVVLLMGWLIALVLWANAAEPAPWWVLALVLAIFAGIIVGVLLALLERIREINRGEEDEAIQY